ncbi:MAG: glutathione S-transferase N-terminal domain-containing protein [Proteobacteria bacterium]|jgi:glutathione S-transferase|nr:glutathione S-transferase N-terminal domain-containing protein [Pseudomonadota bacterium]
MKFYDSKITPNPRRARIFLAEKGISLPTIEVNILEGDNLKPEFLAINPRGLLPTLELDDGTRFDEVMAICRYFECVQPEPPLLGRNAKEMAIVESRQRKMEFDGMIGGSEVFRNQHPNFAQRSLPGAGGEVIPAIPGLVERGTQSIARFFKWLEIYLNESEFVAGDIYTMADITALCAVDFVAWVKFAIPPQNTRTLAWYAKVSARPSAEA